MSDAGFAAKLRELSSKYPSISYICRCIGMNRQQFNKYISGQCIPSPRNLDKICKFFKITPEDMFAKHVTTQAQSAPHHDEHGRILVPNDAFRLLIQPQTNTRYMSRYVGYYYVYRQSEQNIFIRWLLKIEKRSDCFCFSLRFYKNSRRVSKAEGVAFSMSDRLVFIGQGNIADSPHPISMLIYPSPLTPFNTLAGVACGTLGLATRPIFASTIALEFLGTTPKLQNVIRGAGFIPADDPTVSSSVRHVFVSGSTNNLLPPATS